MISFVILHYKNIKDTIECIESIKKLDNQDNISIVVVDNNSLEKSDIKKINRYTKDLILLDDNLGVAKAYNIGATYAKDKYKPDFICTLNNDILINQKDFVKVIKEEYKKYKFDMLGPKIICPDGDSVNPFPVYKTLDEINYHIKKNNKLIKIYSCNITANLFEMYLNLKHLVNKPVKLTNGLESEVDAPLHGCFIIFSKKYFNKYINVLCSDTFLFHEEEFLYFRCIKNKLTSVYSNKLEIIHKEGQSLKLNNNYFKRRKFKFIECNKSLNILKEYLENNKEI